MVAAAEEAAATKLTIVLLSHGSEIASQQAPETQTEQTGHQDLAFRQLGLSSVCPRRRAPDGVSACEQLEVSTVNSQIMIT